MKKTSIPQIAILALLATALPTVAQTTFFTDNFSQSTTNLYSIVSGSPTASATSYDIASTKNTIGSTTIAANDLHLTLTGATGSGFLEAQAMFRTNGQPLPLAVVGDNIEIAVVFTNSGNTIFNGSKSALWIGLFSSGGNLPLTNNLANSGLTTAAGSPYASGNCAAWQGYGAQINSGGTARLYARPVQTAGTSADQDLVADGFGSGAFTTGTTIATLSPNPTVTLATSGAYTLDLRLTLTSPSSLSISNFIFQGAGTGGTVVFSQGSLGITNATFLADTFDGFSVGLANSSSPGTNPVIDISSVTITGQSTPITTPPTITVQPVPAVAATNGYCEFTTLAVGSGVTYQWHRNNTLLTDGADIAGATSSTLVVSPAKTADSFPTANGYYCVVTGTGNYSTNTVTNSLTLYPATNLTWTASSGPTWDLNNTPSFEDPNLNAQVFIGGDPVNFVDSANPINTDISLVGNLGPSSMYVSTAAAFTFGGSGRIVGPCVVTLDGEGSLGEVIMSGNNTYSGGTLLTNAVYVSLDNYESFGTGPVTLNNAGGTLDITNSGSATVGINGVINVLDNSTIQVDANGTFATVFLNDLSGTVGKTLTINPKIAGTTNRFRAYGTNTVFNANLALDTVDSGISQALYNGSVFAPYNANGTQTFNGVISGAGGMVQRGTGTTILNNSGNTYSGGTFATAGNIAFGVDSIPTSGTVTSGPIGTGPLFVEPELGSANGSGTVLAANGARTIANPIEYPTSTNNQTLIIGGTNSLTFTGPYALNGQNENSTVVNRTLQVNNTGVTILSGAITDNGLGFGLTKTGTNALYLNGASTYTGNTTNTAGLLAGTGSLASSVVVTTNGSIGGGSAAGPGTLTLNGNLTLTNGNGFFRVNRSGTSDQVSVGGTLVAGGLGTINVSNVGTTLQPGDTFNIFNKAVTGGSTLTVAGANVNWTNKLALNGSIQVLSAIVNYPTNLTVTFTGTPASSTIGISWPATHLGWILQAQTNAFNVGLRGTNWVDVPNTAGILSTNIVVTLTNKTVFFRLRSPN